MRVCVVGTGYVGLVSGACLAEVGHTVACVDVDSEKVSRINRGETPIFEDGLQEILRRNVGTRLSATTSLREAFAAADVALICVGTPFDGSRIDLSYVLSAARQIGELLRDRSTYCVVAVKSTVIPGTTDGPVREALESASGKRAGVDFGLGMNPEFLAEGVAVRDFMEPDRIVVGGIDERSANCLADLYTAFPRVPLLKTQTRTAEMIKYTSNSLLATLISFSNEIAAYCEAMGDVDVADVMRGVHLMKHLSYADSSAASRQVSAASFLWAGCGFGGSCFPKDVRALTAEAGRLGVDSDLLQAVMRRNDEQPLRMVEMLRRYRPELRGARVAVLGMAFKPGTDDVRESPALRIVAALVGEGAEVVCHDPIALDNARAALLRAGVQVDSIRFEPELAAVLNDVEAVLLVTSWPDYRDLPVHLSKLRTRPWLIDGRRFINRDAYERYVGIGMRAAGAEAAAGSPGLLRVAQSA